MLHIFPRHLPLDAAQAEAETDGTDGYAADEAGPVAVGAEPAVVSHEPAQGQADDPVREYSEAKGHVYVFITAQRTLQWRVEAVSHLHKDGVDEKGADERLELAAGGIE